MPSTPPRHFCLYMSTPPPVNTLTGGVENYVGGVKKFWGASHPPQANLCTRPCLLGLIQLQKLLFILLSDLYRKTRLYLRLDSFCTGWGIFYFFKTNLLIFYIC